MPPRNPCRWRPGTLYRLSAWVRVDRLGPGTPMPYLKCEFQSADRNRDLGQANTDTYDAAPLGKWQRLVRRVSHAGGDPKRLAGVGERDQRIGRDRGLPGGRSPGADRAVRILGHVPAEAHSPGPGESAGRPSQDLPDEPTDRGTSRGDQDHACRNVEAAPGAGRSSRPARAASLHPRRRPQRRRAALAARGGQHHARAGDGLRPDRRQAVSDRRTPMGAGFLRLQDLGAGPDRRHGPGHRAPAFRTGTGL